MKFVTVRGHRWWVPETRPITLAVRIEREDGYYPAVREKLLRLMRQTGPFPEVLRHVAWIMEPQGLEIEPTNKPENLVDQVLATSSVGEMVRAGAPWSAAPAEVSEAIDAVEAQDEMSLADFLA